MDHYYKTIKYKMENIGKKNSEKICGSLVMEGLMWHVQKFDFIL